jgi:excisionase family DNA binding protein
VNRLLRIEEAADVLGISEQGVYRLIGAGELRTVDVGVTGKRARMRIRADELDRLIDRRTTRAPRQAS